MSTMKKMKQLFIATKRHNKYHYIAKLSEDKSSFIIQRVIRINDYYDANNDPKEYHNVATIIDNDDYVFCAFALDDMQYDISCRIPVSEYEDEIPEEYAKYKGYYIECVSPYNNVLRVHLDCFNPDALVFNRFVVTRLEGDRELVAAYIEVTEDDELGATLFGYPAGMEVENN